MKGVFWFAFVFASVNLIFLAVNLATHDPDGAVWSLTGFIASTFACVVALAEPGR